MWCPSFWLGDLFLALVPLLVLWRTSCHIRVAVGGGSRGEQGRSEVASGDRGVVNSKDEGGRTSLCAFNHHIVRFQLPSSFNHHISSLMSGIIPSHRVSCPPGGRASES